MKIDVADAKTVIEKTRKAREALEAKGAFTEANAATHIILALEALIRLEDLVSKSSRTKSSTGDLTTKSSFTG